MKNPPWLAAAGWFSARDNAQRFLGSQWNSSALVIVQMFQHFGVIYELRCGADTAKYTDRILVGHTLLKYLTESDYDGIIADDCPL